MKINNPLYIVVGLSIIFVLMIVFVYIGQNNKRIEELVNQNEKLITEVEGLSFETVLLSLEFEITSQCRDAYIIYKMNNSGNFLFGPPKYPQGLVDCQNYWKDIDTELYDKIKDLPFNDPVTDLEKQLEEEKKYQKLAGETNDYKEGVASFLEKRKPNFKGN